MKSTLLTLVLIVVFPAVVYAQGVCDPAEAEAVLDANNVRANIFNNGMLFWRGGRATYEVPKDEGTSAMFTAGLWAGGFVGDDLRVAAARYSDYQFWPGPLTESGAPPADCSAFDRIYSLRLRDLLDYDVTGVARPDLADWPWHLGAPVIDGDGDPDNYNLEGGDRPEIRGHQTLWWVMNDAGNTHTAPGSNSSPIKLEVQAMAFAARRDGPLNDATFYRYKLIYRGFQPLDSAYVTFFADADLGNANDDYVGSDTTRDLGFIYNADDDDEGIRGYGENPPALGARLVKGPLADIDGKDNDDDGAIDEAGERLGMTAFFGYADGGINPTDPANARQYYNYMRARRLNGRRVTVGGDGRTFSDEPTNFMFPGDPATFSFWSEVNADGDSTARPPGDKRLIVSSGPFTMQPGDEQEVVFALVWARGADHLASVTAMKQAATTVRAAFETEFDGALPDAPAEAVRLGSPAEGAAGQPVNPTLHWEAAAGADEYLIQLATDEAFTEAAQHQFSNITSLRVEDLDEETTYYWRVRSGNISGFGPWSEVRRFSTSKDLLIQGDVLRFDEGTPVFVEIAGPVGADPCGADATDTGGCEEAGGNNVWFSTNGTGDYSLAIPVVAEGPETSLGAYAPNDFEIRVTEEGSYAYHLFTSGSALQVPFEVWDIGPTGPFNQNDPTDDVRLIPVLFSDSLTPWGECSFGYDEGFFEGRRFSDRLYAYYPAEGFTYDDYAAFIEPLVEADFDDCPDHPVTEAATGFIETGQRPLQRIVFVDDTGGAKDVEDLTGTVIRFYTTDIPISPPLPSAPVNRALGLPETVALWWNVPPTAQAFHLQVGNGDFSSLLVDDNPLVLPTFTLTNLPGDGSYYWRLRAQNAFGVWSDWSAVWAFTVGAATAVEDAETGIPTTFRLGPNYPNPFNPSTTIRFGVPTASDVRVTVYDVLGRRVATLVEERLGAGWHTASWEAQGLSSGVYFYQLEAEGYRESRAMLLVR